MNEAFLVGHASFHGSRDMQKIASRTLGPSEDTISQWKPWTPTRPPLLRHHTIQAFLSMHSMTLSRFGGLWFGL